MSDRPSWREEAQRMSEAVPYARSQRMRRRLRQRAEASTARMRWHGAAMAAFAAGAAVVLLSMFVFRPVEVHVAVPRLQPPPLAAAAPDPALHAPECRGDVEALAGGHTVALVGPCRVSAPGLQIVVAVAATVGGNADAITLDAGEAELDVDPEHPRAAPFSVTTPAGRIEVTGTRFTVRHDADGGALTLHEGHVRMVNAGRVQHVVAGQQITWSAEGPKYRVDAASAEPESSPPPEPTKKAPRRPSPPNSRALVEEVERLRAAGEYTQAMTTLESALPTLPRRDREVLSFELGKLLERGRGIEAACAHWNAYADRFPRGRYADLVEEERARLSCDED